MKRKFSKEYDLKDAKYGGFVIRITESRVDIETKAKDWKIMFSASTYEYGSILNCIKYEDFKALHLCAVALFVSRVLFRDATMIPKIFTLAEESIANIAKKTPKTQQPDEEILAEEKVIHEKTVESINELEAIKNKDQNE